MIIDSCSDLVRVTNNNALECVFIDRRCVIIVNLCCEFYNTWCNNIWNCYSYSALETIVIFYLEKLSLNSSCAIDFCWTHTRARSGTLPRHCRDNFCIEWIGNNDHFHSAFTRVLIHDRAIHTLLNIVSATCFLNQQFGSKPKIFDSVTSIDHIWRNVCTAFGFLIVLNFQIYSLSGNP